jgi:hypothetical protein
MMNLLADDIQLEPLTGYGPLGNPGGDGVPIFAKFISSAVGLMTIIAIIWFVFTFFLGAIGIIGAGSDKQALESSRKKIVTGIIGLIVTIAAIFIIRLIGTIFGINFLDLQGLFAQLTQ